jgi:hypothetical protein
MGSDDLGPEWPRCSAAGQPMRTGALPIRASIPRSRVAMRPSLRSAISASCTSVTCRWPWMWGETWESAAASQSSGQKLWRPIVRSVESIVIADVASVARPTTDGFRHIRTNPNSVTGHVAQPSSATLSNHCAAVAWCTCDGQAMATSTLTSGRTVNGRPCRLGPSRW